MPFMAEAMYQNLSAPLETGLVAASNGKGESVHLDSYPEADTSRIDQRLSEATRLAMRVSSLGRSARSSAGIKVRQPLQQVMVKLRNGAEAKLLAQVEAQVKEELNVYGITALSDDADLREYVECHVQPDQSVLGPKYGSELPEVAEALSSADPYSVARKLSAGQAVEVGRYALWAGEVLVTTEDRPGYATSSDGGITIALDTEVSPELLQEGLARELVHMVQNMRRTAGFDIADRIVTYYQGPPEIDRVVDSHGHYIRGETLSNWVVEGEPPEGAHVESRKVNGLEIMLGVMRESP
jgi:isoleucyl-tRNA synthetase